MAIAAAASAGGCASYHAAPLTPRALVDAYAQRTLDPGPAQAEAARLAPEASVSVAGWDRLSLFAAALQGNPSIAEVRAHAQSAEAAARAARAGPSITLTLTGEYARTATESSPWLYGVTSDVPVDLGARRGARVDSAEFAAIGSHYDYEEAVWSVRMALRRALAECFLATREVEIGEELNAIRTRQLAALQARFQAGEAARSDLERVRTDAAGDARRLTDAQARLTAARVALAGALGVPLASVSQASFVWDGFDAPRALSAPDEMRASALLVRADILRAAASYDQAESDLRGEVARQWPEFHIGPGYTWERGLVKLPFSIGLVLPPLDFAHNNVRAAEAHRTEAGRHLEAAITNAEGAVDASIAEQSAALDALDRVRRDDLLGARHAAEQADDEIASGAIDRVDWCAAQVSLRLGELAEVDALRRVHAAQAGLEDALRRPLEGPELSIDAHVQKAPGGAPEDGR